MVNAYATKRTGQRGVDRAPGARLTYPGLIIDLDGCTAWTAAREVMLTHAEFVLLTEFARHPSRVLRYDEIAAALGHKAGSSGPTAQQRVRTLVMRLRQKLKTAGYECITTVLRVGYRFEA